MLTNKSSLPWIYHFTTSWHGQGVKMVTFSDGNIIYFPPGIIHNLTQINLLIKLIYLRWHSGSDELGLHGFHGFRNAGLFLLHIFACFALKFGPGSESGATLNSIGNKQCTEKCLWASGLNSALWDSRLNRVLLARRLRILQLYRHWEVTMTWEVPFGLVAETVVTLDIGIHNVLVYEITVLFYIFSWKMNNSIYLTLLPIILHSSNEMTRLCSLQLSDLVSLWAYTAACMYTRELKVIT